MSIGVTIPLEGLSLDEHRDIMAELVDLGYTNVWAGEAGDLDAVVPLAAAAAWQPSLHVGTSIVPAFTRGPAVLAMTAASLAELAPGRATIGIGASSPVVVQDWNGTAHVDPFARSRDTLAFLRRALAGDRVTETFETFSVNGFRLGRVPEHPPQLLLAALRPRMLRLAATAADGAVTTWVSPAHTAVVARELQASKVPGAAASRLVVWVTVCPDDDPVAVRDRARPLIAMYLNIGAYAAFHRWLGNEALLEPVWTAWAAGDRAASVAAVSDELVDQLIIHGPAEHCRQVLDEHLAAGATDLAISVQPGVAHPLAALRAVAPRPR